MVVHLRRRTFGYVYSIIVDSAPCMYLKKTLILNNFFAQQIIIKIIYSAKIDGPLFYNKTTDEVLLDFPNVTRFVLINDSPDRPSYT